MAIVDPARAALITQEYRYAITQDSSIKALFPSAREIVLTTNLDATAAQSLANKIGQVTKTGARTFSVAVEDVLFLEDFTVAPNRYTLAFDRHPAAGAAIYTVISAKVDYFAGRTVLTVRG